MEGFGTNLDIFMFVANNTSFSDPNVLFEVFVNSVDLSENEKRDLKQFCQTYVCSLKKKWISCNRTRHTFIKKYETWLQENINWPEVVKEKMTSLVTIEQSPCSSSEFLVNEGASTSVQPQTCSTGTSTSLGNQRKQFSELSPLQKRRRVEELLNHPTESLAYATGLKAQNKDVADIIKLVTDNPEKAMKIKDMLTSKKTVPIYSADKALGILTSLKLSKWQYTTLRACAKEEGIPLYPSYKTVLEAKRDCYSPKDSIDISENGVRVKLQAILDKTVSRLGKYLRLPSSLDGKELTLLCKWGFDGASGQSLYKQSMVEEDDSSNFMCSFVPIRLDCDEEKIWENPKPSSTMFCRPLFFKFASENKLDMKREQATIEAEIAALVPSIMGNHAVKVKMLMTMIDGNIVSKLSETSTQTCDICKATPSEMNKLHVISEKPVSTEIYQYGLSTLHAWIRCMECLLHIAYRLDFKTWQTRDANSKELLKARKQMIQQKFRDEMGLLVDIVKQGAGTTNDGNTARKFFSYPVKTAAITGLDSTIIQRFATILGVITCGEPVNVEAFENFARLTAERYVKLYGWYYMPSSVHKLLLHGAEIIRYFNITPIGKLSEEASEARNKDFKKIREHHSRKFCRRATNEDIFNGLLVSSDPYLSSIRPVHRKSIKTAVSDDMKTLLINEDDTSVNQENIEFVDVSVAMLDSDLEDFDDNC